MLNAWCWTRLKWRFYFSHYKSFSDSIKSHRSLLQPLDTLTRNLYFSSVFGLNKNLIFPVAKTFLAGASTITPFTEIRQWFFLPGSATSYHKMPGQDSKSRILKVDLSRLSRKPGEHNIFRSTEREFRKANVFCFHLIYSRSHQTGYFSLQSRYSNTHVHASYIQRRESLKT